MACPANAAPEYVVGGGDWVWTVLCEPQPVRPYARMLVAKSEPVKSEAAAEARSTSIQRVGYRERLRRALMRARTVENSPPAEPTNARTMVGFSGESVQPDCAWRGAAASRRQAAQSTKRVDLFMAVLAV